MPGGGAEIRAGYGQRCARPRFRGEVARNHQIAHRLGIKTNATMLYGHVKPTPTAWTCCACGRRLSRRFQAFILWPSAEEQLLSHLPSLPGSTISDHGGCPPAADNFRHQDILGLTGLKLAQAALFFGANDMDGTVVGGHFPDGGLATAKRWPGRTGAVDPGRRPDAGGRRSLRGRAPL